MQVEPSSVRGVELVGPGTRAFVEALERLLGREPDELLKPAVPFSVIARNDSARAMALLGVRFDMLSKAGKPFSVVHYADTLRHPEKAALQPGATRLVCAEALYTDLVLRGGHEINRRGPMNLETLRTVREIRATLDCAAFADGEFGGPDSLGAFERFKQERAAEIALLDEVLQAGCAVETLLEQAMEISAAGARDRGLIARRVLARRLSEALAEGGPEGMATSARSHRLRIALRLVAEPPAHEMR
jgi:hypothetical protein